MARTTPPREKTDYVGLQRSVAQNHLKTEVAKKERHSIKDFITTTIWKWLRYYIKNRFGRKAAYPSYVGEDKGIYPLEEGGLVGIVSDWATDTDESCAIITRMGEFNPGYTVHVGDTYFVGAPSEIEANFLDEDCPWVRGYKGSFALLGNHEMYSRGIAFFAKLLPTLGMQLPNGNYAGQGAGFFCLQNEHWRVLGLDTGYHSIGKFPFLEMLWLFEPDCRLPTTVMDWLRTEVKLGDPADKRGLVILTHHQYMSAFMGQKERMKPAEQLAELIGTERPVIWIWGHEHKFALYQKAQAGKGITAYGRCIGNGGMPVELKSKEFIRVPLKKGSDKLVMVDTRLSDDGFGYNGYAMLKVSGAELVIQYYDSKQLLVEEAWTHTGGTIAGRINYTSEVLQTEKGKKWEDAVG